MEFHPTTNNNRITEKQLGMIEIQLNQRPHFKVHVKPVIRNGANYGMVEFRNFLSERFNVTDGIDLIDVLIKGKPKQFNEMLEKKGYFENQYEKQKEVSGILYDNPVQA